MRCPQDHPLHLRNTPSSCLDLLDLRIILSVARKYQIDQFQVVPVLAFITVLLEVPDHIQSEEPIAEVDK